LFLGVGSDEAIDNVIRVFCAPGKESLLLLPPTYGMYKVLANTNDVRIVSVPLTRDFQLDMPKARSTSIVLQKRKTTSNRLLSVCLAGPAGP